MFSWKIAKRRSQDFEHYLRVKKAAEVHLAATDLHWLIVRPGALLDQPGSGRVSAGPALEQAAVPRDDVADAVRRLART